MAPRDLDIAIAGAGPAGLTAALAMRYALGNASRIGIFDRSLHAPRSTIRTYAISAGPKNMLDRLDVWRRLARPQPVLAMNITDSKLEHRIRQAFLQFAPDPASQAPLAWIVEHDDLMQALRAALKNAGISLHPAAIERIDPEQNLIRCGFCDSSSMSAGLLLGCDGVNSRIRDLLHIATTGWPYHRSALVATVKAEIAHEATALQHFLPAGTFALLPMTENRFSVVWVEKTADAERYRRLPAAAFQQELSIRAGQDFGDLELLEGPELFPLGMQLARRFTGPRAVLLADAAHAIHPLAGQGLNLGLSDIAHLAEALREQVLLGLDPGAHATLLKYERSRRFEVTRMLAGSDALFWTFIGQSEFKRIVRDIGLGVVNQSPSLKSALTGTAAGQKTPLAPLMQARPEASF